MMKSAAFIICLLLLLFLLEVEGACVPETQCFGNGDYTAATQTCKCYAGRRTGLYTGECCESIDCKSNATCKHGYCGPDGLTCSRCQTGWTAPNCDNVTSCFPWFPCKHGSCTKSRMQCDCEPGWVGDMCDRSLCAVKCIYGACPNDPNKCKCYENYLSPETGCDRWVGVSKRLQIFIADTVNCNSVLSIVRFILFQINYNFRTASRPSVHPAVHTWFYTNIFLHFPVYLQLLLCQRMDMYERWTLYRSQALCLSATLFR